MIESRCGILCSECKYRELMHCKGCINIDKPFWGEYCPVKSCCENNGIEHCGICDNFPVMYLPDFHTTKNKAIMADALINAKFGQDDKLPEGITRS